MAVSITHTKVSAIADGADTSEVLPSDWNAEHTVSGFGTAAEKATGTSGATIPLLDGVNTWSAQNTFAAGTITTSQPATWTQTWNAAGVTFTGLKLNVTATASAAASLLADLQVAATSQWNVTKAGKTTQLGVAIVPDGVVGAPSIGWTSEPSTGIYRPGAGQIGFAITGSLTAFIGGAGLVTTNLYFGVSTADVVLLRDGAANTLAQRSGTAAQISNHYDTWASATDYHRLATKTSRATLASVSGATVTATAIIPDGAVVVGVTTKVTVSLGTGGGTSGYQVGDGVDADRWGDITGTVSGTSSDNTNWTATTIQAFTAASDIVITAVGGNFNGTGTIYVSVQYLIGQCD